MPNPLFELLLNDAPTIADGQLQLRPASASVTICFAQVPSRRPKFVSE